MDIVQEAKIVTKPALQYEQWWEVKQLSRESAIQKLSTSALALAEKAEEFEHKMFAEGVFDKGLYQYYDAYSRLLSLTGEVGIENMRDNIDNNQSQ